MLMSLEYAMQHICYQLVGTLDHTMPREAPPSMVALANGRVYLMIFYSRDELTKITGPVGPPGGPYQIDMVYTPPGASSTSTGEAVTTQRHTFKKVEYDNLSNNELKCAQEKLEKYKQTFAHHEDVSNRPMPSYYLGLV